MDTRARRLTLGLAALTLVAAVTAAMGAPGDAHAAAPPAQVAPEVATASAPDAVELRGTWYGVKQLDGAVELRLELTAGAMAQVLADAGVDTSAVVATAFVLTLRPAPSSNADSANTDVLQAAVSYESTRNGTLSSGPGWRHLRNAREPRPLYQRAGT